MRIKLVPDLDSCPYKSAIKANTKGKKGKKEATKAKPAAVEEDADKPVDAEADADDEPEEGGTKILSKKEKEKLKKERDKVCLFLFILPVVTNDLLG